MLYEEWKSRYKNLKNFNTVLQRCPRFWPLAPPRGMNPGVYSLGISEDPPRYLSSKFDASVRSDCWDISIWKTLTQCDGNGNANANANANANVDDRGDYNSSPCTSYRRAKNGLVKKAVVLTKIIFLASRFFLNMFSLSLMNLLSIKLLQQILWDELISLCMHYCHAKATFKDEQRKLTIKEWTPMPLFFSTATSHQYQHLCKICKKSIELSIKIRSRDKMPIQE